MCVLVCKECNTVMSANNPSKSFINHKCSESSQPYHAKVPVRSRDQQHGAICQEGWPLGQLHSQACTG